MSLIFPIAKSLFIPIESRLGEIEFDLPNENGGLEIDWQGKGINHELLSYKLVTKHHGYRLVFDFTYDDWSDGSTHMKFKSLKNDLDAGARWKLRPRNVDQYATHMYEVICTSDNFKVANDSGGEWHTGFHIQFSTVELVDSIDWLIYVPDSTTEYAVLLENVAAA